jgi:hypothetical protein
MFRGRTGRAASRADFGGGRRAASGVLRRGAVVGAPPECYGGVRQLSSEQSRARYSAGRRRATTTARTGLRMPRIPAPACSSQCGGLPRFGGFEAGGRGERTEAKTGAAKLIFHPDMFSKQSRRSMRFAMPSSEGSIIINVSSAH